FPIVLSKFEGLGEQEGIEARSGASESVAGVQAGQALFLGTQTELREQRRLVHGGGCDAFAESGDGFSDDANACFIFRRKKEWAEEGAMDAIAEGELGVAQLSIELLGETGSVTEHGQEGFAPLLGGFGKQRRRRCGAAHLDFAPDRSPEAAAV